MRLFILSPKGFFNGWIGVAILIVIAVAITVIVVLTVLLINNS